jgi:hypothetical protein
LKITDVRIRNFPICEDDFVERCRVHLRCRSVFFVGDGGYTQQYEHDYDPKLERLGKAMIMVAYTLLNKEIELDERRCHSRRSRWVEIRPTCSGDLYHPARTLPANPAAEKTTTSTLLRELYADAQ